MSKIFDKSIQAVKDFEAVMTAAHNSHANAKKEILDNYKGRMMEEKLRTINDILYRTEAGEKQKLRQILAEDFSEAIEKVNKVASASVPDDFISSLETIRVLGETITERETVAFLEKYRDNYPSARAISIELRRVGKPGHAIVLADDMIEDIEKMHTKLKDWVNGSYNPNTYMTRLMVADVNLLTALDDSVSDWIGGGFIKNGMVGTV